MYKKIVSIVLVGLGLAVGAQAQIANHTRTADGKIDLNEGVITAVTVDATTVEADLLNVETINVTNLHVSANSLYIGDTHITGTNGGVQLPGATFVSAIPAGTNLAGVFGIGVVYVTNGVNTEAGSAYFGGDVIPNPDYPDASGRTFDVAVNDTVSRVTTITLNITAREVQASGAPESGWAITFIADDDSEIVVTANGLAPSGVTVGEISFTAPTACILKTIRFGEVEHYYGRETRFTNILLLAGGVVYEELGGTYVLFNGSGGIPEHVYAIDNPEDSYYVKPTFTDTTFRAEADVTWASIDSDDYSVSFKLCEASGQPLGEFTAGVGTQTTALVSGHDTEGLLNLRSGVAGPGDIGYKIAVSSVRFYNATDGLLETFTYADLLVRNAYGYIPATDLDMSNSVVHADLESHEPQVFVVADLVKDASYDVTIVVGLSNIANPGDTYLQPIYVKQYVGGPVIYEEVAKTLMCGLTTGSIVTSTVTIVASNDNVAIGPYTPYQGAPRTLDVYDIKIADAEGNLIFHRDFGAVGVPASVDIVGVTDSIVSLEEELGDAVAATMLAASAAGAAQTTATDAATAATAAQTTATDAATAATAAQTTATAAASAASTAQTTATDAASAASTAQTTATDAASAASTAQTTATDAATAAGAAQSTADTVDARVPEASVAVWDAASDKLEGVAFNNYVISLAGAQYYNMFNDSGFDSTVNQNTGNPLSLLLADGNVLPADTPSTYGTTWSYSTTNGVAGSPCLRMYAEEGWIAIVSNIPEDIEITIEADYWVDAVEAAATFGYSVGELTWAAPEVTIATGSHLTWQHFKLTTTFPDGWFAFACQGVGDSMDVFIDNLTVSTSVVATVELDATMAAYDTSEEVDAKINAEHPALGTTWSTNQVPMNSWYDAVYADGVFVAVSCEWVSRILTSGDGGETWVTRADPTIHGATALAYGNGVFIALNNGPYILISSDAGETWVVHDTLLSGEWNGVVYADGLFVMVGLSGGVATSPDGLVWTPRTSGTTTTLQAITYGDGLYVACMSGDKFITSLNGIDWSNVTVGVSATWVSITYGGGSFVAVARSGTGDRIVSSLDGTVWASSGFANTEKLWDVIYADGAFILSIGDTGRDNTVASSADGVDWAYMDGISMASSCIVYGDGLLAVLPSGTAGEFIWTTGTYDVDDALTVESDPIWLAEKSGYATVAEVDTKIVAYGEPIFIDALANGFSNVTEGAIKIVYASDGYKATYVNDAGRVTVIGYYSVYSVDAGDTWVGLSRPDVALMFSEASDNTEIIIYSSDSSIRLSEDGGATWSTVLNADITGIDGSSDMSTIRRTDGTTSLYTSTNLCNTWTPTTITGGFSGGPICLSGDANTVLMLNSSAIGLSTNGGVAFSAVPGLDVDSYLYGWISMSSDASTMLVGNTGKTKLYASTDGGTTFTKTHDGAGFTTLELSQDGNKLIAARADGLYVSYDLGVTWVKLVSLTTAYTDIAISPNGLSFVAGKEGEDAVLQVTLIDPVVVTRLEAEAPVFTEALTLGGSDVDGSWRMVWDATHLIIQYRKSGVWTEASNFVAP